jgi:mismatch-specific thymine-DNA glycosylase
VDFKRIHTKIRLYINFSHSLIGILPPNIHSALDDKWLLKYYDIGFINFVERPTHAQKFIYFKEFVAGASRLKQIIAEYNPKVVVFVGIDIYKHFTSGLSIKKTSGPQPNYLFEHEGSWGGCLIYVLPSTSARARTFSIEEKME